MVADLWADRVLYSEFARQGLEYGLTTSEELSAISDAFRHGRIAMTGSSSSSRRSAGAQIVAQYRFSENEPRRNGGRS